MAKHEDNALITFAFIVIGILSVLVFWALLRILTTDAKLEHSTRENHKATMLLIEQRKKFEELLKTIPKPEKGE